MSGIRGYYPVIEHPFIIILEDIFILIDDSMDCASITLFKSRLTAQASCSLTGFGLPFLSVPLADLTRPTPQYFQSLLGRAKRHPAIGPSSNVK